MDFFPYFFSDYNEELMDSICEIEKEFLDSEKYDNQYILGFSTFSENNEEIVPIFDTGVSSETFLKFPHNVVYSYLFCNSTNFPLYLNVKFNIEIIKINIIDVFPFKMYVAINKTFWLKLIQRKWKKIMKIRKNIVLQRSCVSNQMYFQIHGKYPTHMRIFPTLHGMMVNR
jgi:hypothetical protein